MWLMTLFVLGGCHFKSTLPDTAEPTEPVPHHSKSEPVQPEPAQPEPVQPEPVQPEPVQPEPVQPEPVQPEPVQPEPVQPEPVQPEPIQPEPAQPEPAQPEPAQPEPAQPEPVQIQSMATLRGQIVLDQSNFKRQDAELKNAIVYFEPSQTRNTPLPTTDAEISTRNKRFEPNVLAITAGSTISFPNMDRILHNVFSVSSESEFDLGLYSAGTSKHVTFDEPGVIYVHCNVHHSMQADILVLDTPHFTQVDEDGHFELTGLPDLQGTLKTWHPRANIASLQLAEKAKQKAIKQTVVITRPAVPKHRNKFGKPYRRTRY